MKTIRKRLTYANVMSSLAVFLVLGGATAFAASHLGKNSVGTKQLKANAVTTAKIKKNAITAAKIKSGAVTGEKINAGTTPFSRVIARPRTTAPMAITSSGQFYALGNGTYTQGPEEINTYDGVLSVTFSSTCTGVRKVTAYIMLDSTSTPSIENVVGLGEFSETGSAPVTKTIQIGPYLYLGTRFEPGAPTSHTVTLYVAGTCGSGSGITANSGAVDVIGTR